MKCSSLFLLLCCVVAVLYFVGMLFFLTDHEPGDKCEMTYMFEYPQYVRILQKVDEKYPKYGLYAYGEGKTTRKARNMQFDGIPVLFIPGNAGSHQQVRSLSSVALRKALNSRTSFHFDYFTVDLNSEFSALYGPILYDQLDYVLSSLERILELYRHNTAPPKNVILIGHSVGGIVALKAAEKNPSISVLITLAAPLRREPLFFDRYAREFYTNNIKNNRNIALTSIAGGYSDKLVPSYLTSSVGNNSLNLVATNVPKCWVESNHVQILWCKQLVLAINRALFDSVNPKTRQMSTDVQFIRSVFRHHLIQNSGGRTMHLKQASLAKIDYRGDWIESLRKQYTVDLKKGAKEPQWYMVGITALPQYEQVTVLAVNLEVPEWVFACNAAYPKAGSRVCVDAEHLTPYSEIVPSVNQKRRLININLHELRKRNPENTHVVFRALPTSESVTFHVDIHGSNERKLEVSLAWLGPKKKVILTETPEKALVYELLLSGLTNLLQMYQLFVEPVRCDNPNHHGTASLVVPWANEGVHVYFTESQNKPLLIRLQTPKPVNTSRLAKVRLTLDPTCTYKLSIRLDVVGILGQLARYYSTFLLTNIVVVFLLAFQCQLGQMGTTQKVPIFFSALTSGLKYNSWVIALAVLTSKYCSPLWQPEFELFHNDGYFIVDHLIASIILFMASIVVVLILVGAYCVSMFTLESTVHKLTLKLLAKSVTFTIHFSDYFMTFLHKVPLLVVAVLVAVGVSTCGGLALLLGLVFYFLKLTQMSQDYIEQVVWFILRKLTKRCKNVFSKSKDVARTNEGTAQEDVPTAPYLSATNNAVFFHSSMFFLWVIVCVLNIPAVLTWAHNFKYSRQLVPDESLLPGLVLSICALPLWQFDLPRTDRKFTKGLQVVTLAFVALSVAYATVSVYRLNYMMTILFALVVAQQCFAPKMNQENTEAQDKDPQDYYDDIKTKLD